MIIPKLNPSNRRREYDLRSYDEIAKIVFSFLLTNKGNHRELDKDILGLDPLISHGWQSMGVLHFLGLKNEFKGIFKNYELKDAIKFLKDDPQDFSFIIELLESTTDESDNLLIETLHNQGRKRKKNFDKHYETLLQELDSTDGSKYSTKYRREQVILRTFLFEDKKEAECAICHRNLPLDLLVAGHIKPRSKCNQEERIDFNVVMPICKIGCDDFFEKGYIFVNAKGLIVINEKLNYSKELKAILDDLEGKKCEYFNDKTAKYFEFKHNSLNTN